jgi:hypothetical protein
MRSRTAEHKAAIGMALKARGVGQSETKFCPRCKQDLPRDAFPVRKHNGHSESYCVPCKKSYGSERSRRYYANHPEHRERRRQGNQRAQFKRKYGITVDEFERMKAQQGGVCAICGNGPHERRVDLSVDHCHATGVVRGLLCDQCNTGLGSLRDSPELLERALEYLRRAI